VSELVHVRIEERGDVVIAHLSGELDIASSRGTGDTIGGALSQDTRALVVDCSELTFLDSSGVNMLFSLARRLGSRRQELRVVAPSGAAVARVLELVEFHRAAPLHAELDDALAGLDGNAA
jgi:anti-anti-sigma factor